MYIGTCREVTRISESQWNKMSAAICRCYTVQLLQTGNDSQAILRAVVSLACMKGQYALMERDRWADLVYNVLDMHFISGGISNVPIIKGSMVRLQCYLPIPIPNSFPYEVSGFFSPKLAFFYNSAVI